MMIRTLQTVDQVIDACGGTAKCAELCGRTLAAVSNWRAEQKIAPQTILVIRKRLAEQHLEAPSMLWGIPDPDEKPRPTKRVRR
jgi:hypothetical protein